MVRWVIRSILHGVDPLHDFSFQPVLHDWCYKGWGMCYPVCGMVHIKEPLLLIRKSSPCGRSGFSFSLSEWSFTICPTPYNRKIKCVECIIKYNISFLPTVPSFHNSLAPGARCSSMVRAFFHGHRIDPSWGGPIELFLVPASAPRLVLQRHVVCAIPSVGWCI